MRPQLLLEARAALPRNFDWLAPSERERLAAMRLPRRRNDFRRGRWTAKRALARALNLPESADSLAAIEICADERGAPYACQMGRRLPCDLSISHRAGAALCALGAPSSLIGCDIEWVEPRSPAFRQHFLSADERRWIDTLSPQRRSESTNLLWSAKESALKALGTGLDIDVRAVRVHFSRSSKRDFYVVVPAAPSTLHGCWGRHQDWIWTAVSAVPSAFADPCLQLQPAPPDASARAG